MSKNSVKDLDTTLDSGVNNGLKSKIDSNPALKLKPHPCLSCGGCCSFFRVSFHWLESTPESFQVPEHLTYKLNAHLLALKTESTTNLKCLSLTGQVGQKVSCSIYENRPSPCRNFKASFEDGVVNKDCDRVRAHFGLPALTEDDF